MLSRREAKRIQIRGGAADNRLPGLFGVLSDPCRFRIFQLLLRRRDLCVTEIARIFNVSVPAASQKLRMLEMTGVVARERDGRMTCYRVRREDPAIRSISEFVAPKGRRKS